MRSLGSTTTGIFGPANLCASFVKYFLFLVIGVVFDLLEGFSGIAWDDIFLNFSRCKFSANLFFVFVILK